MMKNEESSIESANYIKFLKLYCTNLFENELRLKVVSAKDNECSVNLVLSTGSMIEYVDERGNVRNKGVSSTFTVELLEVYCGVYYIKDPITLKYSQRLPVYELIEATDVKKKEETATLKVVFDGVPSFIKVHRSNILFVDNIYKSSSPD